MALSAFFESTFTAHNRYVQVIFILTLPSGTKNSSECLWAETGGSAFI